MSETSSTKKGFTLTMPTAIVIAGVLIAGAILMRQPATATSGTQQAARVVNANPIWDTIPAYAAETDHLYGDPEAPIKIVEYSDLECGFCRRFHHTMEQIVEEYDGQVAWVYRHYPRHDGTLEKARATECVAELAGEEAFWDYVEIIFNEGTRNNKLAEAAARFGIAESEFTSCMDTDNYTDEIIAARTEASRAGAGGTPWNMLIGDSGVRLPINGAQPYDTVKIYIDRALEFEQS